MGLLGDSWDDPRSLATMQLAAGLLSPGSFGQGLGRGLLGYQASITNAKENKFRDAETKRMEQAAADQQAQMAAQQAQAQRMAQFAQSLAEPSDPRSKAMYQAFQAGVIPAADYLKDAYAKPKIARTVEVKGEDGKPYTVQIDESGAIVGAPMPKWVAPHFQGLGDRVEAIDPTSVRPGQALRMGMAPGEAQRIAIAGATAGAASRQAGAAEEANRINREAQQTQIITDPNLGPILVNKGTKTATRATMEDGSTVPGEAVVKARKQADQLAEGIKMARALLPGATGSGIGSLTDRAAAVGGMTPAGAEAASKLKTISGWMVANVPRMEGPQSNFDVLNYQQMAAQVGDETQPVKRRLAALTTLENLQAKYSALNGPPVAPPAGAGGATGSWESAKEQRYQAWKRSQGK